MISRCWHVCEGKDLEVLFAARPSRCAAGWRTFVHGAGARPSLFTTRTGLLAAAGVGLTRNGARLVSWRAWSAMVLVSTLGDKLAKLAATDEAVERTSKDAASLCHSSRTRRSPSFAGHRKCVAMAKLAARQGAKAGALSARVGPAGARPLCCCVAGERD